MKKKSPIDKPTDIEAAAELSDLARQIADADVLYHQKDAPEISDADYDVMRNRYRQLLADFPHLKPQNDPEKRKALHNPKDKIAVVMKEFHRGTLNSSSGKKVTNPKMAAAIGYSEARRAGAHLPKPKKHKK